MTLRAIAAVALLGLVPAARSQAADSWGGSLAVTSDYVVRGISRSDQDPALQLDVHYVSSSGFILGAFASNTRFFRGEPNDVELDGFVGFAWSAGNDWRGKFALSHYAYPWNEAGSGYDYDELSADVAFADTVGISATYSPNAPRYVQGYGLGGYSEASVEITVQRPLARRLSAGAGAGYSHYGGDQGRGYGYFSAAATYDLAPVALTLSYVNTTAGAKALFYNGAERGRVLLTAIWRF